MGAALLCAIVGVARGAWSADPTTLECLGANDKSIALRNDHKLGDARAQALVCAAASCPADVRRECVRRIDQLNASMPTIVFEAKDPAGEDLTNVRVTMDGAPLAERLDGAAIAIDPGAHTFVFEASGQPAVTKQLVIREGEKDRRERVQLGVAAPAVAPSQTPGSPGAVGGEANAPPSQTGQPGGLGTQRALAIASAGVGVIGVALGAVFGLQSISKHNDAEQACPGKCATQSGVDLWNSARSAGDISTVAFVVGGAALAAGAVLWFTGAPSSGGGARVGIGPGGIQLRGAW
jgi:hypothetical protein